MRGAPAPAARARMTVDEPTSPTAPPAAATAAAATAATAPEWIAAARIEPPVVTAAASPEPAPATNGRRGRAAPARRRTSPGGTRRDRDAASGPPLTLATGVFIAGNVGLSPGARYALEVIGPELRVCGPVDLDPLTIALTLSLARVDATAYESRLVLNEPSRGSGGAVIAFMSLAGGTPAEIAAAIERLAGEHVR